MTNKHHFLSIALTTTLSILLLIACIQPITPPTSQLTSPPSPTETLISTPAPTITPSVSGEPLYLSIIWHQHQPLYYKDPSTNIYEKPWVRVHAAKDYVDMAAILDAYPDIQATFNLTPSLLRQLLDLESGALDLYQTYTEIPADALTDEQKQFIINRFFDINPKIIARFPRYQQIADSRANSAEWDTQTWLDLQVLFDLGWTDPDFLTQEPLASLVRQGQNYNEADKAVVLAEHARLVKEVIPLHRRLQDEGRIEITMTPFFHPILPLLIDSNLAQVAVDDIDLPPRYTYGIDAVEQLNKGVAFYQETFGRDPVGMWPAEGAVSQEIVGMVAKAGVQWMASDEEVLARSLDRTGFGRSAQEVVQDASVLYRPYISTSSRGDKVYTIFRDKTISDKVGFTYSGDDGLSAAQDFVERILAIRESLVNAQGTLDEPYLVSVILDGENAWEHYPNDGKKFLHNMYRLLQEEQRKGTIRTITPSKFIQNNPEQPELERLWAGSWVSPDYLTWIGEDEENRAWGYLQQVRAFVAQEQRKLDDETREAVLDAIYTAEGSDWFWWYGSDQNSGDDASFDLQFRRTLQRVYQLMDKPIPTFLKVPVIPAHPMAPSAGVTDLIVPTLDGMAAEGEWDAAGYYLVEGGVQANAEQVVDRLWYGFDTQHIYVRLDGRRAWRDIADKTTIGFYLTRPGATTEQPFSRVSLQGDADDTLLGFGANVLVEVTVTGESIQTVYYTPDNKGVYHTTDSTIDAGLSGNVLELAIPYSSFGKPDAGDSLKLRAVVSEGTVSEGEVRDIQLAPLDGPAQLLVPDLGLTTEILTISDPANDDYGPGSYTYPQDGVFNSRAYDLLEFTVAEDDNNLIFRFTFAGKLNNSWGAPNGMGIHTLDVYIDALHNSGDRKLLPGRNAALPQGEGWDLALWAEGWTPGLFGPTTNADPTPQKLGGAESFDVISDAGNHKITLRIAKTTIADALGVAVGNLAPDTWGYLGIVASQEGFPSGGVWRIRDVEQTAKQWRIGGGPQATGNIVTNHTRILDIAYAADFTVTQEEALGTYPPLTIGNMDMLSADDFAQVPMVYVR
ncbi:MAG: glucodextranase DOMON-like domain-containing protein [Chloroflexota bacterium]